MLADRTPRTLKFIPFLVLGELQSIFQPEAPTLSLSFSKSLDPQTKLRWIEE